jgi:diadenosine tetraphosphate (Ap4A) HIT family hydrolase
LSVNNDPILETQYWVVVLEPNQDYLGQCFVNLKQHKGDLAELSEPEWLDFSTLVKELETAIGVAFNPDLYNWTCLMNNAFRSSPAKPHVHWSVVPRYSKSVNFSGMEFADPQFGHHYDTQHSLEVSGEVMQAIKAEIKKHLK